VVAVPVWIESWEYECCGKRRSVGDAVTLRPALHGVAEASDKPGGILAQPDGSVQIVGTVVGQVGNDHDNDLAALVECGTLQFAAACAEGLVGRVCCTGRLWDTGHGFAGGRTTGRLLDIRWRPALLRRVGEVESVVVGFADGRELSCTDDWPRDYDQPWALELSVWVEP
jgi:hypothetical protein